MSKAKEIADTRIKLESVNAHIRKIADQLINTEESTILEESISELLELINLKQKTLIYLSYLKSTINEVGKS